MFHMKGANSACMPPCGWLRVEDKWAISLVLSINVSLDARMKQLTKEGVGTETSKHSH